ncbi:MAG TPA: hypothetical protein VIO14_03225 [Dehalococcoidia bacterium]
MRLHSGPALAGGVAGLATAAGFAYLLVTQGDGDGGGAAAAVWLATLAAPYAVALAAAFVGRAAVRWPLLVGGVLAALGQVVAFRAYGLPFAFAGVLLLAAALHALGAAPWSGFDDTLRFLAAAVGGALLVAALLLPLLVDGWTCDEARPAACAEEISTAAWLTGAATATGGTVVLLATARAGAPREREETGPPPE